MKWVVWTGQDAVVTRLDQRRRAGYARTFAGGAPTSFFKGYGTRRIGTERAGIDDRLQGQGGPFASELTKAAEIAEMLRSAKRTSARWISWSTMPDQFVSRFEIFRPQKWERSSRPFQYVVRAFSYTDAPGATAQKKRGWGPHHQYRFGTFAGLAFGRFKRPMVLGPSTDRRRLTRQWSWSAMPSRAPDKLPFSPGYVWTRGRASIPETMKARNRPRAGHPRRAAWKAQRPRKFRLTRAGRRHWRCSVFFFFFFFLCGGETCGQITRRQSL